MNPISPLLSAEEVDKIDQYRRAKQTAVLAILFSDIEGSTYATEHLGEQAFAKLRHIHDELFIRIMTQDNAGKIIKEIGDSFLCVFSEPSTAVLKAVEFQKAVQSNKEHLTMAGYTLAVKIGIHLGQVAVENNLALDVFGRHVNRASRIQSIARGGQILTSQAVWENAVGWIKNHQEDSIEWVSYGKTNLKGLPESVDIYGFYVPEMGKPQLPAVFKKKKQKRVVGYLAGLLGVALLVLFSWQQFKKLSQAVGELNTNKSYYVQFDFSGLKSMPDVDTVELQSLMFSQLISVFSPHPMVSEADLIKQFSEKGQFYVRHKNTSSRDSDYFRDTLGFSGSMFVHVKNEKSLSRDSVRLDIRMDMYPRDGHSTASHEIFYSTMENLEANFRNAIQDLIMTTSEEYWVHQGKVTESNDSFVYIRLTPEAKLRSGASIRFMRPYIGEEGLKNRLSDIRSQIAYFENSTTESNEINGLKRVEAGIKKELSNNIPSSGSYGIGINGRVLELYDTTAKASWLVDGKYLLEKPKKGDHILLGL